MSHIVVYASRHDANELEPYFESIAGYLQETLLPEVSTRLPVRLMAYSIQYGGARYTVLGVWDSNDLLATTPPPWLEDWGKQLRRAWIFGFTRLPENVRRRLEGDARISVMFVEGVTFLLE